MSRTPTSVKLTLIVALAPVLTVVIGPVTVVMTGATLFTVTLVEPTLAKELRAAGAYIPLSTDVKFYCVSCAVHRGIVKVRSEAERRTAGKLR